MGGYLAPQIAGDDEKLAGVIVMGANARPLEDVMVGMLEYMGVSKQELDDGEIRRGTRQETGRGRRGRSVAVRAAGFVLARSEGLRCGGRCRETRPCLILVLGGGRDFQAPVADFDLWKSGLAGHKNATVKLYPAMNHLFVAGEGKSTEDEYKKPGHVAPEVVDDIAKFMGK